MKKIKTQAAEARATQAPMAAKSCEERAIRKKAEESIDQSLVSRAILARARCNVSLVTLGPETVAGEGECPRDSHLRRTRTIRPAPRSRNAKGVTQATRPNPDLGGSMYTMEPYSLTKY